MHDCDSNILVFPLYSLDSLDILYIFYSLDILEIVDSLDIIDRINIFNSLMNHDSLSGIAQKSRLTFKRVFYFY